MKIEKRLTWTKFLVVTCIMLIIAKKFPSIGPTLGGIYVIIGIPSALYLVVHTPIVFIVKRPAWRISYQTDLEYMDGVFHKNNWNQLGLSRLESAYLFLMCLFKDNRDSYSVKIDDTTYWVWGEQPEHISYRYGLYDLVPTGYAKSKTIGGRQYKPKNCQNYTMPKITEKQLLEYAGAIYKDIRTLEDIYQQPSKQTYYQLTHSMFKNIKIRTE